MFIRTHIKPWILDLLSSNEKDCKNPRNIHSLRHVSGPLEDGSVVKRVSDGEVIVTAILSKTSLQLDDCDDSEDYEGNDWNKALLTLHQYHISLSINEYILNVDQFSLLGRNEGFVTTTVPVPCMQLRQIAERHKLDWQQRQVQLRLTGTESQESTGNASLSHLLECMGQDSLLESPSLLGDSDVHGVAEGYVRAGLGKALYPVLPKIWMKPEHFIIHKAELEDLIDLTVYGTMPVEPVTGFLQNPTMESESSAEGINQCNTNSGGEKTALTQASILNTQAGDAELNCVSLHESLLDMSLNRDSRYHENDLVESPSNVKDKNDDNLVKDKNRTSEGTDSQQSTGMFQMVKLSTKKLLSWTFALGSPVSKKNTAHPRENLVTMQENTNTSLIISDSKELDNNKENSADIVVISDSSEVNTCSGKTIEKHSCKKQALSPEKSPHVQQTKPDENELLTSTKPKSSDACIQVSASQITDMPAAVEPRPIDAPKSVPVAVQTGESLLVTQETSLPSSSLLQHGQRFSSDSPSLEFTPVFDSPVASPESSHQGENLCGEQPMIPHSTQLPDITDSQALAPKLSVSPIRPTHPEDSSEVTTPSKVKDVTTSFIEVLEELEKEDKRLQLLASSSSVESVMSDDNKQQSDNDLKQSVSSDDGAKVPGTPPSRRSSLSAQMRTPLLARDKTIASPSPLQVREAHRKLCEAQSTHKLNFSLNIEEASSVEEEQDDIGKPENRSRCKDSNIIDSDSDYSPGKDDFELRKGRAQKLKRGRQRKLSSSESSVTCSPDRNQAKKAAKQSSTIKRVRKFSLSVTKAKKRNVDQCFPWERDSSSQDVGSSALFGESKRGRGNRGRGRDKCRSIGNRKLYDPDNPLLLQPLPETLESVVEDEIKELEECSTAKTKQLSVRKSLDYKTAKSKEDSISGESIAKYTLRNRRAAGKLHHDSFKNSCSDEENLHSPVDCANSPVVHEVQRKRSVIVASSTEEEEQEVQSCCISDTHISDQNKNFNLVVADQKEFSASEDCVLSILENTSYGDTDQAPAPSNSGSMYLPPNQCKLASPDIHINSETTLRDLLPTPEINKQEIMALFRTGLSEEQWTLQDLQLSTTLVQSGLDYCSKL